MAVATMEGWQLWRGINKSQCMDFLSAETKKVAVVERWQLLEVQLYKIVHISAHAHTSEVTILSTIFICREVYDLQMALW